MQNSNPLSQYFRQPAIYARLPSGGKFWPPGSLDLPENGELPVYPMTARDEITYRTPDALFNGSAIVNVLESCVPNIKNAWHTPSIDIDALLIAVRIASYGHDLELESKCPNCGNEANYHIDLRIINDSIGSNDFGKTLKFGDLEFFFKPLNYQQINANNFAQFEQQKMMQNANTQEEISDQDRARAMSQALQAITSITLKALANSIAMIRTPDSLVNDPGQIEEFLNNCDRKMFGSIRDHVIAAREDSEIKPLTIECSECKTKYSQVFTLDMTSFFEDAS